MNLPQPAERRAERGLRRVNISLVAGVVVAAIGLLTLMGWVLQRPLLTSFGANLIPMAPSTAALFLLYGAAVCLRAWQPLSRPAFRISVAMAGLGTVFALVLFTLGCLNIHLVVEHLGLKVAGTVRGVPVGHMSPVNAFCFLLASVSFLASLPVSAIRPWRTVLALGAAGLMVGTGFIFLLAYLYGTPLLYGGRFLPPALNSVLNLVMLGLALMALAGRPAGLSGGLPGRGSRTALAFALIFVLLTAGIVMVGYRYYRNYERNFYAKTEDQLSAIADLKVDQLVQYRKERLGDANTFYENSAFSEQVRRFLEQPGDMDARQQLQAWLSRFQTYYEYDRISLFDVQGVERLAVPDRPEPLPVHMAKSIATVLAARQVMFLGFYRDAPGLPIQLEVLAPIYDESDTNVPLGVLVLRIDPKIRLYPFIQHWPVPSTTAETLLVRREGNEVVYLNELRFQTNTALNLRIPLSNTNVLAVKAALGQTGIVEGRDYRGEPVIADIRAVPGSSWFLVAREDVSEAFAPLRERLWQMIFMLGVLIFGSGAGVGLVWRQQHIRYYREKAEAQAERARLGAIVESSEDAIIGKNLESIITSWNAGAEYLYGYSAAEAIGQSITLIIPPERLGELTRFMEKIKRGKAIKHHETERVRKNGERIQESLTLSPVRDAAGTIVGVSAIARDITERKRAEAALRKSEANLIRAQAIAHVGNWSWDMQNEVVSWSAQMYRIYGVTPETFEHTVSAVAKLIHPDDLPRQIQAVEAFLQGRVFEPYEYRVVRPDGGIRVVEVFSAQFERNASGQPVRVFGAVQDITERRQAEAALRESQALYNSLVEQMPAGVFRKDLAGRYIFANAWFCQLRGLEPDQVVGRTLDEVAALEKEVHGRKHPESLPFLQKLHDEGLKHHEEILRTGKPIHVEEVHFDAGGGKRHLSVVKSAVFGSDGRIVGTQGIQFDITERKRTEEIMQVRLRLLQFATDHSLGELLQKTLDEVGMLTDSPIGFYHFVEADQRTISLQAWSTRTEREFCKAEGKGRHYNMDEAGVWLDCVRQRQALIHNDYAALPNRKGLPPGHAPLVRELVVPIFRKGRVVAVLGVGNKPGDYTEKDAEVVTFMADVAWEIAAHKRAEARLRQLSSAVEHSPASIVITDVTGNIEYVNSKFTEVTGYSPKEVIGKNPRVLKSGEMPVEAYRRMWQTITSGADWQGEFHNRRKNGELFWESASISSILDDSGKIAHFVAVKEDITERKLAEEKFQRTLADLERSNKELEQFAYVASHDLQEPLRMVSSYTQLLAKRFEGQLDEKTQKYVRYAVDGATRMQALINDLLAYARVGTRGQAFEPTDSRAALGGAMRNLISKISETQAIVTNADLPTVRADPAQIVLLFQNLIANAIKFRRADTPSIHVSAQDRGREWLFAVQDNGIGIEPRHAERVFVIFQRLHTKEEYPGTGIGLSVCKRIVERHGGKIWFESVPGKGTTFFFTIPK